MEVFKMGFAVVLKISLPISQMTPLMALSLLSHVLQRSSCIPPLFLHKLQWVFPQPLSLRSCAIKEPRAGAN